jgi:hypothetical protein
VIAFAFTTLWDIPLYASLKAGSRALPQLPVVVAAAAGERGLARRSRSFRLASLGAAALGLTLVLPLAVFSYPTAAVSTHTSGRGAR